MSHAGKVEMADCGAQLHQILANLDAGDTVLVRDMPQAIL